MTVSSQDFTIYTGETLDVSVPVTKANGDPLPLAGYSIRWLLHSPTPVEKSTDAGTITISDATFSFTLAPSETLGLVTIGSAVYDHEAKIESPAGVVSVVMRGKVIVTRSLIDEV